MQGPYCLAIGPNAASTSGPSNSIVINASGAQLNAPTGGFYVNPVRNVFGTTTPTYNPTTCEFGYIQNRYVYSYSTGTQTPSQTPTYIPVVFEKNQTLVNWSHTEGSAMFTGTVINPAYFTVNYSLECHSNSQQRTLGVYLELDGSPVNGCFRTTSVSNIGDEAVIAGTVVIYLTPGSHGVRLMMSTDNTTNGPTIAVSTKVLPPTNDSASCATITITRVA